MGKSKKHRGVRRVGPGRYRVRLVFVDPRTGLKKDTARIVEAKSASEAAAIRQRLTAEMKQPARSRQRFSEFVGRWFETKAPSLRPRTKRHYERVIRLHLMPAFGPFWIDSIRSSDIVAWRDRQTDSAAAVNGRLAILRNILSDAAAELGGTSPASRVPSIRTRRERNERIMEPSELRALLDAAKREPHWYPVILMLAHTGVRWSEVAALRWEDVDLGAKRATIRHSHDRGVLDETKSGPVRVVPLSDELATVLAEHRRYLIRYQRPGVEDGWCFPAPRSGRPMHQSQIRKPLHRAADLAGLSWRPSPHCFRHTWNNLLRQVASGLVVRSILGHADESMTEHYSEIGLEERQAAQAAALRLLSEEG